jgi:hypothetical protein
MIYHYQSLCLRRLRELLDSNNTAYIRIFA